VPKEVRLVGNADLPRNSSGKVVRADVEALLAKSP
jgi:acyl-coenzyme A synthetase/AMP-(fatty) acid ligase